MIHSLRVPTCRAVKVFAVVLFLAAALSPLRLRAQNSYGSIVGIVVDSTGAAVPAAPVTVTNIGTGQVTKAQTDAGGKYSVNDLIPAEYKVEVEQSGFKRTEREHVPVQVGSVVRIDFSMTVGDVGEVVQVTSSTPLLQTDTSNLSQQVEGQVVQEMPLNGRNVMNLIALAPGVVPTGSSQGGTGLGQSSGRTAGGIGWNNYQIGGAIQGWSANYIDGVPNNLLGDNIVALVPTQDAIQEFNVVSNNATADYGRFAGGVVNMTTKSGTNAFHGSAYEYLRNADFNANSWFLNHSGLPRAKWNQNQYGVAVTGPIKRDKAFFLFTWENFKAITGVTSSTNLPTPAMQNGVFLGKTIKQDPLYNAATGAGCNIQPIPAGGVTVNGATYSGTGTYIANLYQGTCGDPLNRVLKTFFPAPNTNGNGYNWQLNVPLANTQSQYNGRIDYQLTPNQRLFGRFTYWTIADSHQPLFLDQGSPDFGSTTPTSWPTSTVAASYRTQQTVLGDTYTINPTTVLDVRASYARQTYANAPEASGVNESQFDRFNPNKYYTALAPHMTTNLMPSFLLTGSDNLYGFTNFNSLTATWYNTYSLSASLAKIVGPHTFKAGGEVRLMDQSGTPLVNRGSGYFSYTSTLLGDEFAAFLLGYPSGGTAVQFQNYQVTAGYTYYQGYYLKDDWQVNRKLTLNLGLRYELPGAIAERDNRLAVLLPNTVDPYTGIKGTEAQVGSALYPGKTAVMEKYNLFAPRVGFAYRLTENTVVRGGYGLSYIPNDLAGPNGNGQLPFTSVFNGAATTANIPDGGAPVPLQTVLGCFAGALASGTCSASSIPVGLNQPSSLPPANFMTTYASTTSYKAQTLAGPVPFQPYPYVQQWNASFSHQFRGDWMGAISYAGLKGTNLPQIGVPATRYFGLDELPNQYDYLGGQSITYNGTTYNGLTVPAGAPGAVTCPVPSLIPSTGPSAAFTTGQCLRPNPYYADVQDSVRYAARQNYHSLQLNGQKRFHSGGTILANYTFSKNMADTDSANQQLETTSAPRAGNGVAGLQDYNNIAGEYSLISYDVTSRLVVAYVLDLPFGKGKKFGNHFNGPLSAVVSGWSLDGITIFQSGFPIYFRTADQNLLTSNYGAGQLRPNVAAGCNKNVGGGSQTRVLAAAWFNKSCFSFPTSSTDTLGRATFGNAPRVDPDVRADGIKNFDLSFQKSTPIFESSSFVFRAEFFNIMNRVQFAPPVNTQGSSNFGAVVSQANQPRQIQLSARINF